MVLIQNLCATESELMSPDPVTVRLIAHADRLHILGWQEQGTSPGEYIRTVHPRIRRTIQGLWRQGRVIYHCNAVVGETTEYHRPWWQFDQYLAYSNLVTGGIPTHHYAVQNLTSKPHRRFLTGLLLDTMPNRGRISFTGRAGIGAGEDAVDHHYPDPQVEGFWAPGTADWQLTEHMDVPSPPTEVWNTVAHVLVSETMVHEPVVPTEKTWQAISVGKPFVCAGPPGLNLWMREQGYEPMLGLDYSWDTERDWQTRIRGLVEALRDHYDRYTPEQIHYNNQSCVEQNLSRYRSALLKPLPSVCASHYQKTPSAQNLVDHLYKVQAHVSRQ